MNTLEPYSSIEQNLIFPKPFPIHEWCWGEDNTSLYILQEIDNNIIHGDVLGITRELQKMNNNDRTSISSYLRSIFDNIDAILTESEKKVVSDIVREMKHQLEYGY